MTSRTQPVYRQPGPRRKKPVFGAAFKAGIMGGLVISLLLILYQLSLPFLQIVFIPMAMIIVWVVTGIGAAMMAGDRVITGRQGWKTGMLAGLVSGIVGGITSMVIAALGLTFTGYGEGVLTQFSDTQLTSLVNAGFTEQMIITSGSVLSAMVVCGVGGMVLSALLGGVGGWLYPKFGE